MSMLLNKSFWQVFMKNRKNVDTLLQQHQEMWAWIIFRIYKQPNSECNGECGCECFPVKLTWFYIQRNFQGRMNTFQSHWKPRLKCLVFIFTPPKNIYIFGLKKITCLTVLRTKYYLRPQPLKDIQLDGWRWAYRTQSPPLQPPEGMPYFWLRTD